ncbi:GntR family transcriptional regulator [Streptomyces sp. NPDC051985]|uniref:GntR family transcriptional regulator n=1 Tax=Streptomyces sp. NPDC051985 TaxID=3155807 RepID=UPI0034296E01
MSSPAAGSNVHPDSVLSELPPRDTTALVRDVRERLRLAIVMEEIPAGTKLNQVQVAKQLGVSRMPVRTAIGELASEGLLEPVPGGGVAVRRLNERDVRNVYDVRAALESQAVRSVARQHPAEGLVRIRQVLAVHKPHVRGYGAAQLLAADREFHMAILDATENPYFRQAITPVWSTVERAMVRSLHITEVFTTAWEQHEEIAQALESGDPDLAEARIRHHLGHAVAQMARAMSVEGGPPRS